MSAPTDGTQAGRAPTFWADLQSLLPHGKALPDAMWEPRHRLMLAVIAAHALVLPAFGIYRGWGWGLSLCEGLLVGVLGALAAWRTVGRRFRAVVASLALITSSSILVQFSGGVIEAHFHYFIVVALITMYQDWVPFALAIAYTALNHGLGGALMPQWVYNHPDAIAHPWKWALVHAVAILGESVALLAFWASAEQSRARSDLVLDTAGDAVIGLDPRRRISFANPAACGLLGVAAPAILGRDAREVLQGVAIPEHPLAAAVTRAGTLTRSDGRLVPVEWSLTPAEHAGMTAGSVLVVRDITVRRELERQLAQHQALLEERVAQRTAELTAANRELEAFSYTVSHDLRSPLRGIDGFSRILLRRHGKDLPPESREMLEQLGDGAVRMGDLIESILLLSRIGRGELDVKPMDLSAMASDLLAELAQQDPNRKVRWWVQPGLHADCDPQLMRLALRNLLGNAWKFTRNRAEATITLRRGDGPDASFVLEDNGAGFDMTYSSELFQPFHRMHQPHEFEGTGIGLATVHRILQRHGGRIRAEGRPGVGARFTFELPPRGSRLPPRPSRATLPFEAPLVTR